MFETYNENGKLALTAVAIMLNATVLWLLRQLIAAFDFRIKSKIRSYYLSNYPDCSCTLVAMTVKVAFDFQ